MGQELSSEPGYENTIARLDEIKRVNADGVEFWMAREVHAVLGYPVWDKFTPVIERAAASLWENKIDPSHHIARTSAMMEVGNGGQRKVVDYFLSKAACRLIAMNGDPNKPEIAAAQAYFVVQTERMEQMDAAADDAKRLELREKVAQSHKLVSAVAQEAGVRSQAQGLFHDARYQGLYGMSLKEVKAKKGIGDKVALYDVAGPLELSANDFQMNLAADVIRRDKIKGETKAISTNKAVGQKVRRAMQDRAPRCLRAYPWSVQSRNFKNDRRKSWPTILPASRRCLHLERPFSQTG